MSSRFCARIFTLPAKENFASHGNALRRKFLCVKTFVNICVYSRFLLCARERRKSNTFPSLCVFLLFRKINFAVYISISLRFRLPDRQSLFFCDRHRRLHRKQSGHRFRGRLRRRYRWRRWRGGGERRRRVVFPLRFFLR